MDFEYTEEQRLLRESLDRLLGDGYGFDMRKAYLTAPDGFSAAMWGRYAELGLLGLPFAEEHGGFGGGGVETMVVMEALGRVIALEPYLAAVVLAGAALKLAGSAAQHPGNLNCPLAVTHSACYFAVRVLTDPDTPPNAGAYRPIEVRAPEDIAPQLEASKAAGAGGLAIFEDPLTLSQRSEIVALASRLSLPAIYGYREFAVAGGLMSYGTDHAAQWQRGAEIVDLILKGAKPADIPVEQPTKFELVVNLKTAKASNFTMPPTIMISADEVIE